MYDFDTLTDRSGTGACKWERRTPVEKQMGIVPMSIADMEFQAPPCVREALIKAAEHGVYGYTDPTPEYYAAVGGWLKARHGLTAQPQEIVNITGVVPALCVAVRAFTQPGEGVIIQTPVYPPFRNAVTRNGRRVEAAPLKNDGGVYAMDFDALEEAAAKPDVHLFLLCSPHNPVGRVWTRAELERVAKICERNNVLVASDEIHADLTMTKPHTPFLLISDWAKEHCVLACAPSKTFNVPGLQLANAVIPNGSLREAYVARMQADGFDNMPYFGYVAAVAAYTGAGPWLDEAIRYIYKNYELLCGFLRQNAPMLTVSPLEGTYLAWIDCRALGLKDQELTAFMREKAHIILNGGLMFGTEGDGFVRLNLAVPRAELQKALDRLDAALKARR